MTSSTAHVATANASRYLQQLCKHFGHKVEVAFTETEGSIALPFGTCRLAADAETLSLTVEGEQGDIARLEKVIGDHLARFAFRETPEITWR